MTLYTRIKSWLAWRRFQARVERARKTPRLRHAAGVKSINDRQKAIVNAALGAGR